MGYDDTPNMFLVSNPDSWEFVILITHYQNRSVCTILESTVPNKLYKIIAHILLKLCL